MNNAMWELLELEQRILARGFNPKQVMRLYRLVTLGDKGAGHNGLPRKRVHTKEYIWQEQRYVFRRRKGVKGPRGYCISCGAELRKPFFCQECGEDNRYADLLGLRNKQQLARS